MSTSSPGAERAQTRLGSPIVSVNSPGPYLRHRVAAERAYRARRRRVAFQRLLVFAVVGGLYLAIGRELLQLTRAKASLLSTQARGDTNSLATGLTRMLGFGRGEEDSVLRARAETARSDIPASAIDGGAAEQPGNDAYLLRHEPE